MSESTFLHNYGDWGAQGAYADAFGLLGEQVQIATSTGWNDGLRGKVVGIQQAPTVVIRDEDGQEHHIPASLLADITPVEAVGA